MRLGDITNVLFLSCVLMFFYVCSQPSCSNGWFGHQCKYKCRCNTAICDVNGLCTSHTCQGGWFGPACQYADLAYSRASVAALTDGNDVTCNTPNAGTIITITFRESFVFTWLRIHVRDQEVSIICKPEITILAYSRSVGRQTLCRCQQAQAEDCFRWVYSYWHRKVYKEECGSLSISIYLHLASSGRNVALKETALQDSTFTIHGTTVPLDACKAVDGDTNQDIMAFSCSHTHGTTSWTLTLSRPRSVHRYVIFNRNDKRFRLIGFQLESFNSMNRSVFVYKERTTSEELRYSFLHSPLLVQMVVVSVNNSERILTLCEVEIYGDSVCDAQHYGRDCELSCNCLNNEACFVSTGACPSGCPAGFYGVSCLTECTLETFGRNCNESCSPNCAPSGQANVSSCDTKTGVCLRGCQSGSSGALCRDECRLEKFGINCNKSCSPNCEPSGQANVSSCDTKNGSCLRGCQSGFSGALCRDECNLETFGINCNTSCSPNCAPSGRANVSSCDTKNGSCLRGCKSGSSGALCRDECNLETFGINCNTSCSPNCAPSGRANVSSCDTKNGSCLRGCQSGFSGALCRDECRLEKFGINCNKSCSPNCEPSGQANVSSCDTKTGACLRGCQSGSFGALCRECNLETFGINCNTSCSPNCAPSGRANVSSCDTKNGSCLRGCQSGFSGALCRDECNLETFGINCNTSCSPNCAPSGRANVSSCDTKNGSCLRGCQSGFSGALCRDECRLEKFGINCNTSCSPNCAPSGRANVSSCDAKNGSCLRGCKSGSSGALCRDECNLETFGINCNTSCSPNCAPSGRANVSSCNTKTGACLRGCQSGFSGALCRDECRPEKFGINCIKSCSRNCEPSGQANMSSCDIKNGSCLRGCQSGSSGELCQECELETFGINCNESCSPNCAPSSQADVSPCDTKTGVCLMGCQSGSSGALCQDECELDTYGINCKESCNPNCAPSSQANVSSCDNMTGACLNGCQSGSSGAMCRDDCKLETFGKNCNESCSLNCAPSGQANVSSCDNKTGICLMGCQRGFTGALCRDECKLETFGIHCNESCSPNCAPSGQANVSSCDNMTGVCLMGCQSGSSGASCQDECELETFGINCNESCSPKCAPSGQANASSCDTKTGVCLSGCQSGSSGALCRDECKPQTFGKNCNESCSPSCAPSGQTDVSSCDTKTGACTKGCQSGFSGASCQDRDPIQAVAPKSEGLPTDIILGLIGFIAALFVLAICFRRKEKPRRATERAAFNAQYE